MRELRIMGIRDSLKGMRRVVAIESIIVLIVSGVALRIGAESNFVMSVAFAFFWQVPSNFIFMAIITINCNVTKESSAWKMFSLSYCISGFTLLCIGVATDNVKFLGTAIGLLFFSLISIINIYESNKRDVVFDEIYEKLSEVERIIVNAEDSCDEDNDDDRVE